MLKVHRRSSLTHIMNSGNLSYCCWFFSSKVDCTLFVKFGSHYCLYVLVYGDDILITRSDATVIDQLVL